MKKFKMAKIDVIVTERKQIREHLEEALRKSRSELEDQYSEPISVKIKEALSIVKKFIGEREKYWKEINLQAIVTHQEKKGEKSCLKKRRQNKRLRD